MSLPQYRIDHRCLRGSRFSRPRFAFTVQCTSRKLEMWVKAFERGHRAIFAVSCNFHAVANGCVWPAQKAKHASQVFATWACRMMMTSLKCLLISYQDLQRLALKRNSFLAYFLLRNRCNDVNREFFDYKEKKKKRNSKRREPRDPFIENLII